MSFLQFYRDQHETLPIVTTKDNCAGKTFIVTGANVGLGFEAAKHLVSCQPARVILAVRSTAKGEDAKRKIEDDTGVTEIAEVWPLDLASFDSVKAFAKRVETLDRVDAVIENAGVVGLTSTIVEGFESSITVNVIGTFLLAALLLPKLRASAAKLGEKTRLTVVGSGASFYAVGQLEKLDEDVRILEHLSSEHTSKADMEARYPITKLAQLYFLRELAGRHPPSEGVIISYINPGLCRTELGRDATLKFWIQLRILWAILGRTAEEGSRTLLHGALAAEECHGKYLSECRPREYQVPDWVTNESGQKLQQRLWDEVSAALNATSPGCI